MISGQAAPEARAKAATSLWHDLMVLFKLRIVVLLLFAAIGGAFLAAEGRPGLGELALVVLTGGLSAMGSSALNEYIERESDGLMNRTRKRPLVTGAFGERPYWVPFVAAAMIALPVMVSLTFNPPLAIALAAGAFIYVVVYTVWLKPRTALNIVIGGAAGSCAVLSGSAAVGAWANPAALALALVVFLWTPIHFWALAIVYKEDYARASVPMLPVSSSPALAARWGLVHGLGAGVVAVLMAFFPPALGPVYLVPALAISVALIVEGARLVRNPVRRTAWHLFHTSNLFLFVVLLAVCLDGILHLPWPF